MLPEDWVEVLFEVALSENCLNQFDALFFPMLTLEVEKTHKNANILLGGIQQFVTYFFANNNKYKFQFLFEFENEFVAYSNLSFEM